MSTRTKTLTVAVTGPTGDIGRSLLRRLEEADEVGRVLGMARRPFDPEAQGWSKTEYRQGDVLDTDAVAALVAEADVVVHLAFLIFGDREQSRDVNLQGTRNVFEAAVAAGCSRLVYTSSVAAYGFDPHRPAHLTEDVPAAGSASFYYSAQKAELERVIASIADDAPRTDAYVFRPCIVAGRDALLLVTDVIRQFQLGGRDPVTKRLPLFKPVIPDNGVPFQLVHHDDVADALALAIAGSGEPGVYNLASADEITMADVARELGWIRLPIPDATVALAAGAIERLPFGPSGLEWVHSLRVPSILDCTRARERLGWEPTLSTREILRETAAAARATGVVQ